MRHAKSSWEHEGIDDHDRPLNKRGLRDAPRMAMWLMENDCLPELVISSTARRAKKTMQLMLEQVSEIDNETEEELYHASPKKIMQTAAKYGNGHQSIMLVGHNPGMEDSITKLTGESEIVPTACIAVIDLDIKKWSDLDLKKIEKPQHLFAIWRPKEIKDSLKVGHK